MGWIIGKIVSNPLVLIALCAAAFVCGGSAAWWLQGLRVTAAQQKTVEVEQAFTQFRQATTEVAQKAKAAQLALEQAHQKTLEQVRSNYESNIQSVRNNAVTNYLARLRDNAKRAGGSGVRTITLGLKVDDGAVQKCIPDDDFIRNAAEDASKVSAWQVWCELNQCPVE